MAYLDLSLYQETENLSPQQKKFNRLIQKIEKVQALLFEWQQTQQKVQSDAAIELFPLYSQWHQLVFRQFEVLWEQKNTQKFAKTHLERLDEKIETLLSLLLEIPNLSEQQQALIRQVAELYKIKVEPNFLLEFSQENLQMDDEDYKADEVEMKNAFKAMIADQLGVDEEWIDFDFDLEDSEDFMQKVKAKFDQEEESFIQNQLDDKEREEYQKFAEKEKKKILKKQAQFEEAQKMAGQSLKGIYKKIASVIHPDREQDEQKRIEKTELLQQANTALEEKDLLTLLKLRAYTEHGDQQQSVKIANEHLKSYNLLLEDKIEQLQFEVDDIVYSFDWEMSGFYKQSFKPLDLIKKYKHDLAEVQNKLEKDQDLLMQYQDITMLKKLLKSRMFGWSFG